MICRLLLPVCEEFVQCNLWPTGILISEEELYSSGPVPIVPPTSPQALARVSNRHCFVNMSIVNLPTVYFICILYSLLAPKFLFVRRFIAVPGDVWSHAHCWGGSQEIMYAK